MKAVPVNTLNSAKEVDHDEAASPNCIATLLDEPSKLDLDDEESPRTCGPPRKAQRTSRGGRKAMAIVTIGAPLYFAIMAICIVLSAVLTLSFVGICIHRATRVTMSSIEIATHPSAVPVPTSAWVFPMPSRRVVRDPHGGHQPARKGGTGSRKPANSFTELLAHNGLGGGQLDLPIGQPWLAWDLRGGLAAELAAPDAEAMARLAPDDGERHRQSASQGMPSRESSARVDDAFPAGATGRLARLAVAIACVPWGHEFLMREYDLWA